MFSADLVYGGRCLQDDKPLDAYGISNGASILVLKKLAPIVHEVAKGGKFTALC
jgi:hypothetical protein